MWLEAEDAHRLQVTCDYCCLGALGDQAEVTDFCWIPSVRVIARLGCETPERLIQEV